MATVRSRRVALNGATVARLLGEWENGQPGYIALADRLNVLIADGRISRDTWLPSERELAIALGKSRTLVIAAYRKLKEAGHLESIRGAGSVVVMPAGDRLPSDGLNCEGMLDLSRAAPSMWSAMPRFVEHGVAQFSESPGDAFDLIGQPDLRSVIAERFTRRGLPTVPRQIMVTLGAQHAVSILAHALIKRGDRVLVETPSYPHAIRTLRHAGARIDALSAVPVGLDGWDLERFDLSVQSVRPALAYLMPDFQNPTGRSMDTVTRQAMSEGLAQCGSIVVIDETTAELSLADNPATFPPFASCFRDQRFVLTLGSLSKTVWGGLRVGWIRAHEQMIEQLAIARQHIDLGTPAIEQRVAALVIPHIEDALSERRSLLRASRAAVERYLTENLPDWKVESPHGGLTSWVNLGRPLSTALALSGRDYGVALTPGPNFGVQGEFESHLRIPFTESLENIEAALPRLRQAWESVVQAPSRVHHSAQAFV